MAVPDNVLHSLHTMDGYDQMLALDKIAREHGIGVEQLLVELQEFIQRGATAAAVVSVQPQNDEDGYDYFFNISNVRRGQRMRVGLSVKFDSFEGQKGPEAENVSIV